MENGAKMLAEGKLGAFGVIGVPKTHLQRFECLLEIGITLTRILITITTYGEVKRGKGVMS